MSVSAGMEERGRRIALKMMEKYAPAEEYAKAAEKLKPADTRADLEKKIADGDAAWKYLMGLEAGMSLDVAATAAGTWLNSANAAYLAANTILIAAEALTAGQVDITLGRLLDAPSLRTWFRTAEEIAAARAESGLLPLLRRYYLKKFTPFNPPAPDLIRMVVREAFDPKMLVTAPTEFTGAMAEAGFNSVWCDRLWTAHFLPIDLRQAYENLWRGYWDKPKFMDLLRIADIHPMWREDIYAVAFRPPSARELGYGFDTNVYTKEDIARFRRWGGLSETDADKAADAMVAYRTEAEREALRREALADCVAGLDTEDELRTKLTRIGGRPEVVELWISRAKYRAERDLTLDRIKTATTDFMKNWSTENEFRQDLIELGVVPERREVIIKDALSRRAAANKAEAAEKHKLLTSEKISKARELGLIGDLEFIRRHVAANYTEDDARLLLAIELTPRPVTPEEISRRRATVTSKLERARRRWETLLAGVQDQIEITALQRENAESTLAGIVDVSTAQITVYDTMIAEAPEEKRPLLRERRMLVIQNRDLAEFRGVATIRRLIEQLAAFEEKKVLMIRQRNEELGDLEEELKLIGGAAA